MLYGALAAGVSSSYFFSHLHDSCMCVCEHQPLRFHEPDSRLLGDPGLHSRVCICVAWLRVG
jgi:hypothetical protein